MNNFDVNDVKDLVPRLHDAPNEPFKTEGRSISEIDANICHLSELLLEKCHTVDILPTILEEEGYRDLDDGPRDLSAYKDLPVVECKKVFPLRFNRKPKRRLPFPIAVVEEPQEMNTTPLMVSPGKATVSYVVAKEMRDVDLSENTTFIRWDSYPRITKEEIKEFYEKNPLPTVERMRLEGDIESIPEFPRRRVEMNTDMLLNYFDDLEIREEFLAKTRESLFNPHLPWFKQKHLTRRGKAMARKKLEQERLERGEIVEKPVINTEGMKRWSPWKKLRGAPSGRGRRARYLRWRFAAMFSRGSRGTGTSSSGRGRTPFFRRGHFGGRRGYWAGGRGSRGGGDSGGGGEGEGNEGRGGWGGEDAGGGRGSWGGGRGWGGWGQSSTELRGAYRGRGGYVGRGWGSRGRGSQGLDEVKPAGGEWED